MSGFVTGKLPVRSKGRELKEQLQNLGYEFKENMHHYEFSKEADLEEIIDEIAPLCQSLGWNIENELTLVETHGDLAMRSIFDHGRIVREFQRGS
ncbi:hypothetical protein [Zhaonella formicivorans]|uniref:hypothetical protein n=1 Tax=Zhaonella formicivorans TaxID=2528593 RepID=UPI0010F1C59F|nr:hypothetical protein [Zhaonella formicivorans]